MSGGLVLLVARYSGHGEVFFGLYVAEPGTTKCLGMRSTTGYARRIVGCYGEGRETRGQVLTLHQRLLTEQAAQRLTPARPWLSGAGVFFADPWPLLHALPGGRSRIATRAKVAGLPPLPLAEWRALQQRRKKRPA